jgi:hypothetical protein
MESKFQWIQIQLNLTQIQIFKKWDSNWCKRYWESAHDYGIEKRKNSEKT